MTTSPFDAIFIGPPREAAARTNKEKLGLTGKAMRKASIKETGEELSQAEWARFDAAVARLKAERDQAHPRQEDLGLFEAHDAPRASQNHLQDHL